MTAQQAYVMPPNTVVAGPPAGTDNGFGQPRLLVPLDMPSLATLSLLSTSPSIGIGYAAGAGGTVTQATDKSTGVTLNTVCGEIIMNNAALAAAAEVTFTVTNSRIAANDVVVLVIKSVGTAGAYLITCGAVAAGSFKVTLSNASAGPLSEAVVIGFAIIRAVIA